MLTTLAALPVRVSATAAIFACLALSPALAERTIRVEPAEGTTVVITRPAPPPPTPVAPAEPAFEGQRPAVDVAILLDTSSSMSGLINQARAQLWTIVQQFARAKHAGQTPTLRVALFEYGNSNLAATDGYIRRLVPLTSDLDTISEALFALTTSGGSEHCGQVIDRALKTLDWSDEPNAYQAVFIAGNEPFTQGPIDYRDACKRAIERGVVVNTIHCGAYGSGQQGQWHHGAQLAEGDYFNIDQDRALVHVDAPQDKVIIELNERLNKTYLWFGSRRDRAGFRQNQVAQDGNAGELGVAVAAQRAAVKATAAYDNVGRDLVDTVAAEPEALAELESDQLPDELADKTAEEWAAIVAAKAKERAELQQRIAELSAERDRYVAEKRKELAEAQSGAGKDATLGDVMTKAVRSQLKDRGFRVAE